MGDIKMENRLKKTTTAALMAAVIFVVTFTGSVIPIPRRGSGAYVNLGDTVIYIAAYILGGPAAGIAAAIGSALSDTAAGSVVYILPTFIIKGLMGLVCGQIMKKRSFAAYAIACAVGGAIMTAGYGLFETGFFGRSYAAASLPLNVVQWVAGAAVGIALYPAAKRLSGVGK